MEKDDKIKTEELTMEEIKQIKEDAVKTSRNLRKSVRPSRPSRIVGTKELIRVSDIIVSLCDMIIKNKRDTLNRKS